MASWNEKREGEELEACPVCFVMISKRRRTTHVTKCYETYEGTIDERGLIRCPLYPLHILPKRYLNHHLQGSCEEAQNLLRKYFQNAYEVKGRYNPPPHFLADVPEDLLNKHNRQLLYLLQRDLNGNNIGNNKDLYPDECTASEALRAIQSAGPAPPSIVPDTVD